MKEHEIEKNNVTFAELLEAVREERWDFVDENISDSHLTREQINWALGEGLYDENQNIRDLAATLLNRSEEALSTEEMEKLKEIMANDTYHIVRFRLAIALYQRGDRSPVVEQTVQEAKNDPDIGALANGCFS